MDAAKDRWTMRRGVLSVENLRTPAASRPKNTIAAIVHHRLRDRPRCLAPGRKVLATSLGR